MKRTKKISEIDRLDNDSLKKEADKLIKLKNESKSQIEINEFDIKLDEIKKIIDKRVALSDDNSLYDDKSPFNYYPDYRDKNFNKKIYYKKEFYINKIPKISDGELLDEDKIDKIAKSKCTGFKLNYNQKFLKTFLSSNTPYKSLLLFHGTGVGKTCSSISIAEQFSEELEKYNKKIFILLNPSIKENFKKNIFNIGKVRTKKIKEQCLGDKYYKKIKTYKNLDDLKAKVDRRIANKYIFTGYQAFANRVNRLKENIQKMYPDNSEYKINEKIKDYFSNCVMIIDEAHNIKEEGSNEKILPPILNDIVKNAENMKLILLTATPMFNSPLEILYLLNLLLINDKRAPIDEKDIFDGTNITEEGKKILIHKSRGLVSYLRGENPLVFPIQLFPKNTIKKENMPEITYNKERIKEKIEHLQIVPCVMENHQLDVYNEVEKEGFGAFESVGISVSNIAFPGDLSVQSYKTMISNEGFFTHFRKTRVMKKLEIEPVIDRSLDILDYKNIGNYSSKIKTILENINNSEGIIFIYSRFVWAGIVPLALALEYNGFTNVNGNLLSVSDSKKKDIKNIKTREGTFPAKYMIISGDADLSSNVYYNYIKRESENKNGERVKVILGSESAAEGLDFKYIREVHVLDPWHHLNKIEQVKGRGIRYCSHIDLPLAFRNVSVFLYASVKSLIPKNDPETIDLKIYREAEIKDKHMANVEYILKTNSVDCSLNLHGNKFIGEEFSKKIMMKNSKNETIMVKLEDTDGSKLCNYKKCDFKCNPNLPENINETKLDIDTFDIEMIKDNLLEVVEVIKNMYQEDSIFSLKDIESDLTIKDIFNKQLVYMALTYMIENKIELSDKFDNEGTLEYNGGYYIFRANHFDKNKLSSRDIRSPLYIKELEIDINNNLSLFSEKSVKKLTYDIPPPADLLLKLNDAIKLYRYFDYFPLVFKETLLQYIIRELIKNPDIVKKKSNETYESENEIVQTIYNSSKDLLLYYKKHVYYGDVTYKDVSNKLYGYYIADNKKIKIVRFEYDENEFDLAPEKESKLVMGLFDKKQKNSKLKANDIIGYLEEKGKDIVLKIRDKRYEKKEDSKRTKKTGSICGNEGMKKDTIVDYLKGLDISVNESYDKKYLCNFLEKNLIKKEAEARIPRKKDTQLTPDEEKFKLTKFYYKLEEAIIYKIGEKK
tara:strand:- start:1644 stop:5162 length:3519 start_codon:yes stop_codon:yes gene_type:complete